MDIFLLVFPVTFGFNLIPTEVFLDSFLEIEFITLASLSDSIFINKIFFLIASSISSRIFPTPEKTIFLPLIPAFIAFSSSPAETTSAPDPSFFSSFSKVILELDLTEKHTKGLISLNVLLKLSKLLLS